MRRALDNFATCSDLVVEALHSTGENFSRGVNCVWYERFGALSTRASFIGLAHALGCDEASRRREPEFLGC